MTEHDNEPIPGLPAMLPPGERILWQGAPDWRVLARTAFHTRLVAGYFALLALWALIGAAAQGIRQPSDLIGAAMTIMRVVVKAEAQTRAKPTPIRMAFRSIALSPCCPAPLG